MDEQIPTFEDLPSAISRQAIREKSIRQGSVMLHRWWESRSTVLARLATYLALAEKQAPEPEFLMALGEILPSTATLGTARSHIRDNQWRWAWREQQHALDVGEDIDLEMRLPEAPKVLDPFAGSGTIPAEAARLGCQVFAADLNPVAYNILKTTLDFPASYISPDSSPGTGSGNTWSGLTNELKYWANRMEALASTKVQSLFPAAKQKKKDGSPINYFWFRVSQCLNCAKNIPLQDYVLLRSNRNSKLSVQITTDTEKLIPLISEKSPTTLQRKQGWIVCPFCQCVSSINQLSLRSSLNQSALLGTIFVKEKQHSNYLAVLPEELEKWVFWTQENSDRLANLLDQSFASSLKLPLPNQIHSTLNSENYLTFKDLFLPRQLLVALEYVAAIRTVQDEMRNAQILPDRVEAISTYLAFFLAYLVENNCKLCSWNSRTQKARSAFFQISLTLQKYFVERSPIGLVDEWLGRVLPVIERFSQIPKAQYIKLNDALSLPFPDEFFDAIVTDPPYYNAISYMELADFYWVWESCIINEENSSLNISKAELIESPIKLAKEKSHSRMYHEYQQNMLLFMQEAYRVLKPGRTFCFLLTKNNRVEFEQYIYLGQKAGFEILSLKRFPEQNSSKLSGFEVETILVYFRKPYLKTLTSRPKVQAFTHILEAVDKGKPILFDGLAQLLLENLSQEEIEEMKPPGARGSDIEILMEVLVENDPYKLLEKQFGTHGIRRLAEDLKLSIEEGMSHLDAVLAHFGFTLPSPTNEKGAHQIQDELRQLKSQIQRATEIYQIQGAFLNSCSAIERLLKLSIWGWAQRIFGSERDVYLLNILSQRSPEKEYDLKNLSFGHIAILFRELPGTIAMSTQATLIEQKFGHRHIYKPKKLIARLDSLISLRNKIAHDKENFLTNSTLPELKEVTTKALDDAVNLIGDMVKSGAIPRLAEAIQEIRDKYERRTYRLKLDDNTEVDVWSSMPVLLGVGYLYFDSRTKVRSVEPLILPLSDLN